MEPKKIFFSVSLFLILSNELYNVSHIFLSHFIQKTPLIGKKVLFGPIVDCHVRKGMHAIIIGGDKLRSNMLRYMLFYIKSVPFCLMCIATAASLSLQQYACALDISFHFIL